MKHIIWNPKMECADRQTIREMQLAGVKKAVAYCYERVPYYKKKFDDIGLRPEHIKTFADVKNIPFTTSDDLKENYPFGLFAVDKKEVVRVHGLLGHHRANPRLWVIQEGISIPVRDRRAGDLRCGWNR